MSISASTCSAAVSRLDNFSSCKSASNPQDSVFRANDSQVERGLHSRQDGREVVVEANLPVRGAPEGVASRSASAVAVHICPVWMNGRRYEFDLRLARAAIMLSSARAGRRAVAVRGGNTLSPVPSVQQCPVRNSIVNYQ